LFSLPVTFCYFNPGGEVLANREAMEESLGHARKSRLPPLELWANVRQFRLENSWSIMDTIGNLQFGVPDVQASLPPGTSYDPVEVMHFLRDVTWAMVQGLRIQDGETRTGPGNTSWSAKFLPAHVEPRRQVVAWFPKKRPQSAR
jgi:hypothetical protein